MPICPLTGNPSEKYARKDDAVYLRDPESGIKLPREVSSARGDGDVRGRRVRGRQIYRDYVEARELKLATMRRRLTVISQYAAGPRVLDVGCASGFFMEAALERGFDPLGIELSPVAIRLAQPDVRGPDHPRRRQHAPRHG